MEPRWKGKNCAAEAERNPMSQLVTQLQSSLACSKSQAMLSNQIIRFEATPDLSKLLDYSCFGHGINTLSKNKQWVFSFEEAFYLHHKLQSITIVTPNNDALSEVELWDYMRSKQATFPESYKAYAHLRDKNWVVKWVTQYGGDFVAYRHHPKNVHSEFAVLVMIEGEGDEDLRLRVWSDLQCRLRVSGAAAKNMLLLSVNKNGSDVSLPSCLEEFSVEESVIERWVPEQCRINCYEEDKVADE